MSSATRSRVFPLFVLLLLAAAVLRAYAPSELPTGQDWTHTVRISGNPLTATNAVDIVRRAQADGVFGIEVDNDIPGRYESLLDPTEKLTAIHNVAEAAHHVGNKAFVYIAGLECITANAEKSAHSLAKDHPDWLQRKRDGTPAIFGGGTAFWIAAGDEDVWISPYAADWRKLYMQRVRQIAATGIDGIYVDIPYWMTHFDGWETSWASFDDATVAAFKKETGLDARTAFPLGNFADPGFLAWVDFRIRTITDFMREIDETAKSVSPAIKTIPEIYPGIEEDAVRVGSDVYELYPVVDAVAHEYEFGGGDHMASSRSQLDWFRYLVGWSSFRAFAQGKATWMLNYSWDGDKKIAPAEAMQNLAMAEVMAGVNFWDARGHVMSGSNDLSMRRTIFHWIAANERALYAPRLPVNPVGVYFSPATRNRFTTEFLASYQGILILLMQQHIEYQVVTPRTLREFRGRTLVLPDVRVLSPPEQQGLREFTVAGHALVITGTDATSLGPKTTSTRFPDCPGKAYLDRLTKDFDSADPASPAAFLASLHHHPSVQIEASPAVAAQIARVSGKLQIFFSNFKGLRPGENAVQEPETNIRVRVSVREGRVLHLTPFLGNLQRIPGKVSGPWVSFTIPRIEKGAIARIE
jgi:hypothetical protein